MKTLASIFCVLSLLCGCAQISFAQTISKADILKTVQHLQARCHEAEAAQSQAQQHADILQRDIDALAKSEHDARVSVVSLKLEVTKIEGEKEKVMLALWEWRLGFSAACLAFGIWTFRRPLLALCGVPTL